MLSSMFFVMMYEGKKRRNMHAHGLIHLDTSVYIVLYIPMQAFSMKAAHSFIYEAPGVSVKAEGKCNKEYKENFSK